jgi:ankyrin repeat protein
MMDSAHAEEVVKALIENGADSDAVDEDGYRAIDYAIMYGREDVALILLEQGNFSSAMSMWLGNANFLY